jgi:hypothetical protein
MSISDTFRLDRNFLKKLHERLIETNEDIFSFEKGSVVDSPTSIIPSIHDLEEIISVMFWASTQMEEGRLPIFRAMYAEPTGLATLGLDFDKPISWNTEEIRKLAPAVTPPDGRICVYPKVPGGKLYIQGMQTKESEKDPLGVLFEIIEPARMIVQFPLRKKIAEIKGQECGFIDEEWLEEGSKLIALDFIKEKKSKSSASSYSFLYKTMTQEILTRIRLLRHGGSIIFVPDSSKLEGSLESPIKYKCGKGFKAIERIAMSIRNSIDKSSGKNLVGIMRAEIKSLNKSYNKIRISDSARSVAYLTAVDGATILNNKFEVLSFGAKIKESHRPKVKEPHNETDNQKVKIILPHEGNKPNEKSLTDAFRGKRHLSAARFVINNPKSIAFVVSQDGMITGLVMEDKLLVAYKGLELLL